MGRSRSRSPGKRGAASRSTSESPEEGRGRKRDRSPNGSPDKGREARRRREEAERVARKAKLEAEMERKKRLAIVKQIQGVDPDMEEDKDDTLGGDEDDDLDDEERIMKKMLGFAGFDSTKGKHVDGNDDGAAKGAVRKSSSRKYRQYMNRKGGFNQLLTGS